MKVSEQDINSALELLAKHFPEDTRDIWCKDNVSGLEKPYTAYLGDNPKLGLRSESGWGFSAMEAAEHLISRAGERDPAKLKAKRIADLRQQLAELEAQDMPEPAPAEMAQAGK